MTQSLAKPTKRENEVNAYILDNKYGTCMDQTIYLE